MKLLKLLGLSLIISFASCAKKDPTACFTVDKGKTAKVNEEVQFDASCSANADTYQWSFKSGATVLGTASGAQTKFKFTAKGVVKISLVAKNGDNTSESTQDVEIL